MSWLLQCRACSPLCHLLSWQGIGGEVRGYIPYPNFSPWQKFSSCRKTFRQKYYKIWWWKSPIVGELRKWNFEQPCWTCMCDMCVEQLHLLAFAAPTPLPTFLTHDAMLLVIWCIIIIYILAEFCTVRTVANHLVFWLIDVSSCCCIFYSFGCIFCHFTTVQWLIDRLHDRASVEQMLDVWL